MEKSLIGHVTLSYQVKGWLPEGPQWEVYTTLTVTLITMLVLHKKQKEHAGTNISDTSICRVCKSLPETISSLALILTTPRRLVSARRVKSKQTRSTSENRATEPLELIHSDVCGKLNTRFLSGAEYFLTFVDDRTYYSWIYVLKTKDEVFNCFLKWKALVEKSSGRKVQAIRTDNGGEYTSNTFQEYLLSEGIHHQRTVRKTPEQNGVAERMNPTLVETVRSMLTGARLPQRFWAEALSTAVYLNNRSPTRTLRDVTPLKHGLEKGQL